MKSRGEFLAHFPWLDTAIAVGLVVALGNFPGILLNLRGIWAPAVVGPVGLVLLLRRPDDLSGSRLERVTAIAFLGLLYGLVTAAPVAWAVSWVPWWVAGVEVSYVAAVNAGGLGPLLPPLVRYLRLPRRRP